MIRGILLIGLTVVLTAATVFFGGRFHEIGAARQHPAWVYEALILVRDEIVGVRADGVHAPLDFTAAATPESAALFQKHCAQCHGAPGIAPADFALGMSPVPANPVHIAQGKSPEEIYWVIRNGLKMTGMPAWEGRMSDADMWRITALMKAMRGMSPVDYVALVDSSGGPRDAVTPLAESEGPSSVADADPERGRVAMQLYGCRSCHIIPGIVGPDVHVGPPLGAAGARNYIAGVLRNTPENMVRWIMDPQEVDPLTAMPDLGVNTSAARQMAAYIYRIAPELRSMGPEPGRTGRESGTSPGSGILDSSGN